MDNKEMPELKVNRNIKDSVFRNLFSDKEYLFQLYQALHPEDKETTIDELECVTLENVLVWDIYNDLGVQVGNRLLLLVEAQSSWTENIIIRCLLYLARTLQEYLRATDQSLFSGSNVQIPEMELYVIYTGDSDINKEYITLSDSFFDGKQTAIDVKVKVITDGCKGDIINQYVTFTKVINEQVGIFGRTREAITEAIRICKNQNVLKEYLNSREKEVVDIMITMSASDENACLHAFEERRMSIMNEVHDTLFDQQEVISDYIASDRREQAEKHDREMAQSMYNDGMPVNIIAKYVKRSIQTIEQWLGLIPQA